MSTTTAAPRLKGIPTSLGDDANDTVYGALQATLVELIELGLVGKQLHWTVRGPGFIAVHEQLDVVIDFVRAQSDEVAERLTALGLVPDGRSSTIASDSGFDPVDVGAVGVDAALTAYVDRIGTAVGRLRTRIDAVGEVDPGSEDLLIALLQELEKHRWLLAAGRG